MSVPQPRMPELGAADAALLDTLLREAPIGFALFGPDLCFRRVNDMLARLYGRGAEDHIGQKPSHVWPSEFAATAESAARQVLAKDQPVFGAHQYRMPAPPAGAAPSPAGVAGAHQYRKPAPPAGPAPSPAGVAGAHQNR